MTSMNVSMPQYVVTEQTVAATTHRGRMNAAASDLTPLATTAVLKVICVCLFLACRSRQASIVLEKYFRFEVSLLSFYACERDGPI